MPVMSQASLLWTACLSVIIPTLAAEETVALVATAGEQCLSLRQLRGQMIPADDRELHEEEMETLTDDFHGQNETASIQTDTTGHNAIEDAQMSNSSAHLPYGHPCSKSYPTYNGFTLWLVEDFDQPIDLDRDPIWTWSDGGLKEGQVRFTKEQISFGGGKMRIMVQKNTGWQEPCSHAQAETVERKPLVSGEFRTRYNMFRYGRYEVRMRAPHVQFLKPSIDGNFVASMFVFRAASFRHWREVDMEITGRRPGAISTNVLNADNTSRWHRWIEQTDYPKTYPGINVRAEFHTYSFEWLPGVIRWYIDGKKVREKMNDQLKVPEMSAKVMLNLWIYRETKYPFGRFDLKNDRFPMQSEYDWFRFYRWDGDKHCPPAGMNSKLLLENDLYLTSNNPCDGIPQLGLVEQNGMRYSACSAKCR